MIILMILVLFVLASYLSSNCDVKSNLFKFSVALLVGVLLVAFSLSINARRTVERLVIFNIINEFYVEYGDSIRTEAIELDLQYALGELMYDKDVFYMYRNLNFYTEKYNKDLANCISNKHSRWIGWLCWYRLPKELKPIKRSD